MITRIKTTVLTFLAVSFVVVACSGGNGPESGPATGQAAPETATEQATNDLRMLLASEDRAESDRARDAGRRPADVVEFLGPSKIPITQ